MAAPAQTVLRTLNIEPRQDWPWRIELVGINPSAALEVDLPDVEYDDVKMPNGDIDKHFRGRRKVTNLVVRRALDATGPDLTLGEWFDDPDAFRVNGSIVQLDPGTGVEIERRYLQGVLPIKRTGHKLKKSGSNIIMDEMAFTVDDVSSEPIL